MKNKILSLCATLLLFASVGAVTSNAQEPLNLGEENLLNLACSYINARAKEEGAYITYCRRAEPDKINNHTATIKTKIRVDNTFNLFIIVNFKKSLWWVESWDVE